MLEYPIMTGIMKSVKLGPAMNQKTFNTIRNYNNGWPCRNDPLSINEQKELVDLLKAPHGSVFVEVWPVADPLHPDTPNYGEPIFYAVQVFPVCRDVSLRASLLHTLEQLVTEHNPTNVLHTVYYI